MRSMDIFESLENLPVSEACFEDIITLIQEKVGALTSDEHNHKLGRITPTDERRLAYCKSSKKEDLRQEINDIIAAAQKETRENAQKNANMYRVGSPEWKELFKERLDAIKRNN